VNRAAVLAAAFALAAPVAAQEAAPEAAPEAAVCSGPAFELAQRFVGAWQEFAVTAEGEQLAGRLDTTLEAGGCALAQAFAGADGAFSFRSLGYVEAGTGQWTETYVLSNGRVASYRWRLEGDEIVIDRIAGGDPATHRRLRVRFESADAYRVVEETTPADVEAWTAGIVTMTRRIAAAP
jgi:hypothetical protein